MDIKELYQEIVLDHGKNPRNKNKCEGFNKDAKGHNPLCGDKVHVFIKLDKDKEFPPTFILHNDYLPGKLQKVYNIMERKWKIKEMHVYTSLGANSTTFRRHCDSANVLIVQSVGRMNYYVEGLGAIECNPGDGILIPSGVYHTPYVIEPRITLSFSL